MSAEIYDLGMSCVHCGKLLSARRVITSSIQIQGLHKLDYTHTATGKRECWTRHEAQPHDGWRASAAFDAEVAAAREAETE